MVDIKGWISRTLRADEPMEVYLRITDNCNLECSHCCYESGPGKPSMALEDAAKVVSNLPDSTSLIDITGGEVFTRKNLLYSVLDMIQRRDFDFLNGSKDNRPFIVLTTNGYWAKDEASVNKRLDELKGLGVWGVRVTSYDTIHKDAGLDLERPKLLMGVLASRDDFPTHRECSEEPETQAPKFPFGRTRQLSQDQWTKATPHSCGGCADIGLNAKIDYTGIVYPCTWMIPGTELGDAREERIEDIVERSLDNKKLSRLRKQKDFGKAAGNLGKKLTKAGGYCNLCHYLFSEGLVNIQDGC